MRRRHDRQFHYRLGQQHRNRTPVTRGCAHPVARGGIAVRGAVPLHHHVGVGARPAEPAHARDRGTIDMARPSRRLRSHPQRQSIPVHLRSGFPEVQVLWNRTLLHRQHDLDQGGHPRCRLQMAHVGLHRTDQQRSITVPSLAVRSPGRAQFDGIAHQGSRPVGLHVVHFRGPHPGPRQRRFDDLLLCRLVGHRKAGADAILIDRRTPNHPPDPVAVRLGIAQPLQDHDAAAFAAHVTVCTRIEGLAPPIRRQHPGIGPQLEQPPGQDGVDASCKGQIGLAPLQGRGRLVYRDQRRRTGGIDRKRRPLQAHHEGDPSDSGVERGAGDRIEALGRLGGIAGIQDQAPVFVVADPRKHPRAAAFQSLRIHPGVFERLPAGLQHHALLRVQQVRLDRRNPEEFGVEPVDAVDEAPEPAGLALNRGVGEKLTHAPHAGTGYPLGHGVLAGCKQPPESRKPLRAREPAGHTHHGYRLCGPDRFEHPRPIPSWIRGSIASHGGLLYSWFSTVRFIAVFSPHYTR